MDKYELKIDTLSIGSEESSFKLDRISPSMVGSYLSCPLSFYYGYIAKIKIPQTRLHLLFGSAVHCAIEEYHDQGTEPISVFTRVFNRDELDDEGKKSFSEYFMLGHEMVKNYVDSVEQFDEMFNIKKGKSEFKFREKVVNPLTGEMSRIPLSGILDRITDDGRIIEYKTSKTKWATHETRFKVQSLLYNLWYYTMFGKLAEEMVYIVLLKKYKKTKRDEVIQIIRYKPTLEELASAWEELDALIDMIETGVFERPEKGHARFCDCHKYEKYLGISS